MDDSRFPHDHTAQTLGEAASLCDRLHEADRSLQATILQTRHLIAESRALVRDVLARAVVVPREKEYPPEACASKPSGGTGPQAALLVD